MALQSNRQSNRHFSERSPAGTLQLNAHWCQRPSRWCSRKTHTKRISWASWSFSRTLWKQFSMLKFGINWNKLEWVGIGWNKSITSQADSAWASPTNLLTNSVCDFEFQLILSLSFLSAFKNCFQTCLKQVVSKVCNPNFPEDPNLIFLRRSPSQSSSIPSVFLFVLLSALLP